MFDFEKIEQIIQEKVKPKLNENYGDIELLNMNDGVVEIKLSGNSIECPSLKFIIVDLIE
ncbi:MAG TPA: NifU family protein, partial [Clostridiales bacterium]|nr:NifU family protein [Clostridiales bacterium]